MADQKSCAPKKKGKKRQRQLTQNHAVWVCVAFGIPWGWQVFPPHLPESLLLLPRDNNKNAPKKPPKNKNSESSPPLPLSGKTQLREAVLDVETDCCCCCCCYCCCTCRPLRLPSPGERLCVWNRERVGALVSVSVDMLVRE